MDAEELRRGPAEPIRNAARDAGCSAAITGPLGAGRRMVPRRDSGKKEPAPANPAGRCPKGQGDTLLRAEQVRVILPLPVDARSTAREVSMTIFQVRQNSTRAVLWTGQADTADRALEVAAQAAGYHGFEELPETARADMTAEAVIV
ncbi:MAG: hypothetical protein EKK43_17120 [Methylobacterium sp.]|uniref:hypothetical protein n=1 Tax=Methylobacterium sp. TaxID=409 RepID=UPI000FA41B13|nr:hypothetical protein [Methylobacterium sp.]RUP13375.1 MAG: hypothetical protein EKK43_17120 [Methylobacterium sp.]